MQRIWSPDKGIAYTNLRSFRPAAAKPSTQVRTHTTANASGRIAGGQDRDDCYRTGSVE